MSVTKFRGAVEWALMVGLVFGAGALARAQEEDAQSDAKIIRIGPSDGQAEARNLPAPDGGQRQPEAPKYWIGLLGGPVTPEVRHHVEIPENQGLMIREVVPDSPAAKAGIEKYDILVRANDAELHEMTDLVDLVRTQGEQKGQITLEVLRHGKRDTVYITPTERPANVAVHGGGLGGAEGMPGELQQFFGEGGPGLQQFFEQRGFEPGRGFDFRHFGPGVIVGGQGAAQMPNGVSISIKKEDDQPAKITVKRGDESWEVVGDDPESLKALPDDLRPFVERMLHGGGPANFDIDLPAFGQVPGRPIFDGEQLRQRLEAMERRLEEMQKRFAPRAHDSDAQPAESNDQSK
jgi:membrane-associated protease RseP (regulator of RpoE activity)